MQARERFIKACHNETVDRPTVRMMPQAGRTLPEYLALREKYSFRECCQTPELAAEVTLQPVRRFPVDAAIIFSDTWSKIARSPKNATPKHYKEIQYE